MRELRVGPVVAVPRGWAGARRRRAARLVAGAPLSGPAGGRLFPVFVLWVLAANVVLLRDAARPRSRPAHDHGAGGGMPRHLVARVKTAKEGGREMASAVFGLTR
jgi:hypothetical protein